MADQPQLPTTPPVPEPEGEPFPCPHCGQMLAGNCRLCVACRKPIDAKQVRRPPAAYPAALALEPWPLRAPERVHFPWRVFLAVLAIWIVGGSLVQQFLNPMRSQLALVGVQILTSVWVFYDAQEKGVPKAIRWSLGSLLLWPIIFPWYLVRRSKPASTCPFVEGTTGRLTRPLVMVLLLLLLLLIFKGPLAK